MTGEAASSQPQLPAVKKGGLYANYKTDTKKEWNGVPYTVTNPDESVSTFYLARAGKTNKDYQKELDRRTRPYRRQIELGTMNENLAEQIFMEVFISTVLKGWDGVSDEDGNTMEFNEPNAKKLLTDLPDLYDELQAAAKDASRYRDEKLDAEAKN
jgi:hypothetical protein